MKIYRLEMDEGIDNDWTIGYYSTIEKAIFKAKRQIEDELQIMLEDGELIVKTEELVIDDYTGRMVFGINVKISERWNFGCYVYQIEVDDNE